MHVSLYKTSSSRMRHDLVLQDRMTCSMGGSFSETGGGIVGMPSGFGALPGRVSLACFL
jgi:hypothetical protein